MLLYRMLNCSARIKPIKHRNQSASELLRKWTNKFESGKVSEPESSAGLIISFVLGAKTFSALHGKDKRRPLHTLEQERIDSLCETRLKTQLPVQYAIGEWDFCGLTLKMKPPVFIPRPETEELVGYVLDEFKPIATKQDPGSGTDPTKSLGPDPTKRPNVLEVGCGSGAISLALMKSQASLNCTALDVNVDAVNLTNHNARMVGIEMDQFKVHHCDISSFTSNHQFDGIVSNPPYIPTEDMKNLAPEIKWHESELALHGGEDGLDVARSIFKAAQHLLKPGGWIWLELDDTHSPRVPTTLPEQLHMTDVRTDFYGVQRFMRITKSA